MITTRYNQITAFVALMSTPLLALAHTGHHQAGGVWQGMVHPLSGLDHMLAMVAVGLWAAYVSGRALWLLPTAFVGMMLAGASLALGGIALPLVEPIILTSVVILGLLVAFNVRLPLIPGMALVALFGLFHGQAHALEMTSSANALSYALGFTLVTTLLHLSGMGLGYYLFRGYGRRILGIGTATAGLLMTFS